MKPLVAITKQTNVPPIGVELTWPNLYFVRDETTGAKIPIRFLFTFRRQRKQERDAMTASAFLAEKSAEERRLDLFCLLLTAPPKGFGDFPMTRAEFEKVYVEPEREQWVKALEHATQMKFDQLTEQAIAESGVEPFVAPEPTMAILDETNFEPLSDRARKYFADDAGSEFVLYAMTAYDAAVVPSELLFRV